MSSAVESKKERAYRTVERIMLDWGEKYDLPGVRVASRVRHYFNDLQVFEPDVLTKAAEQVSRESAAFPTAHAWLTVCRSIAGLERRRAAQSSSDGPDLQDMPPIAALEAWVAGDARVARLLEVRIDGLVETFPEEWKAKARSMTRPLALRMQWQHEQQHK